MNLKQTGAAGTFESSDIYVTVEPSAGDSIELELHSSVEKQFGKQIRTVIRETVEKLGVKNARIIAKDTGALDCIIRARVECAVHRAAGITENYNWEELDKWTS